MKKTIGTKDIREDKQRVGPEGKAVKKVQLKAKGKQRKRGKQRK